MVWVLWLATAFGSSLGIMIHLMPKALFAACALLVGLLGMFGLSLARLPGYPLPGRMRFERRRVPENAPRAAYVVMGR